MTRCRIPARCRAGRSRSTTRTRRAGTARTSGPRSAWRRLEAQGGVVAPAAHAPGRVVEQDAQVEVHAQLVGLCPVQEQAQRVRRPGAGSGSRAGRCASCRAAWRWRNGTVRSFRCSSISTVSSGSSRGRAGDGVCWMSCDDGVDVVLRDRRARVVGGVRVAYLPAREDALRQRPGARADRRHRGEQDGCRHVGRGLFPVRGRRARRGGAGGRGAAPVPPGRRCASFQRELHVLRLPSASSSWVAERSQAHALARDRGGGPRR